MLAISFIWDQIWLQSSKICFREIRPEIIVTWLYDDFRHCNHIWSLLKEIAIINGPIRKTDCNHIRFRLSSSLQSYWVLFVTIIPEATWFSRIAWKNFDKTIVLSSWIQKQSQLNLFNVQFDQFSCPGIRWVIFSLWHHAKGKQCYLMSACHNSISYR